MSHLIMLCLVNCICLQFLLFVAISLFHAKMLTISAGLAKHEPGSSFLHDIDTDFSSDDKTGSTNSSNRFNSPFNCSTSDSSPFGDPLAEFMEAVPSSEHKSSLNIPELFLPGLVIHIVPQKDGLHKPLWKCWRTWERSCRYRAYVAKREAFKDIIVSPYMFLDHLPWRYLS